MLRLLKALRIGTDRALHKAGPDMGQQIYLNLWSVDILSISAEQVSQPDMQVGSLLGFGKLLLIF